MDAALLLPFILLISFVQGELDTGEFEYENEQLLETDEALLKDYLPVQSPQEQRFLEGLKLEAVGHVLFPELYLSKEDKVREEPKVYEIKGQPEIEESYMNERARRGKQGCPQECPVYKPVCGSDGKVYESECHMRKENCGISGLTTGSWQRCRGRHYLCPSRCLDFNDPVCGSDGRIYHNICVMRKRNCGKLIEVLPVQKCYENVRQSKDSSECPEDCQEMYKPVCGSDGVIYYNECFMRKRTCKFGIVQVDMEACVQVPKCPEVCLPIADPVCGSDGRLYINQCRMLQQSCGQDVKVVARSYCGYPTKEIASPTKQMK